MLTSGALDVCLQVAGADSRGWAPLRALGSLHVGLPFESPLLPHPEAYGQVFLWQWPG